MKHKSGRSLLMSVARDLMQSVCLDSSQILCQDGGQSRRNSPELSRGGGSVRNRPHEASSGRGMQGLEASFWGGYEQKSRGFHGQHLHFHREPTKDFKVFSNFVVLRRPLRKQNIEIFGKSIFASTKTPQM